MTPLERGDSLRRLEELQKSLRQRGFGPDSGETGTVQRLMNLCRFLQTITRQNGVKGEGALGSLQKALCAAPGAERSRQSSIQRLCDLKSSLENLLKKPGGGAEAYAAHLQQVRLSQWKRLDKESDEDYASRCKENRQSLKLLGLDLNGDDDILSCHKEAWTILTALKGVGRKGGDCHAETRWLENISACEADWEWAYAQVLVKLARECLEEGLSQPKCCERAVLAMECVEEAIKRLERRSFLQVREQGLYGLLAKAHLLQAMGPFEESQKKTSLLCALSYGRRAVEMEPERAQERLILIQVYSELGDYPQAKIEAEIVLHLDSGSKSLRSIGASFWDRVAASLGRDARTEALDEAVSFFTRALGLLESEAFDGTSPVEQAQAHAGLHFWLGKFLCERMDLHKGIAHEEIGRSLGFKPLESRVNLGWAYLETGAYEKSEQCFQEVLSILQLREADGSHALEAPGEEKPLDDLRAEAHLGLSFLFAEHSLSLKKAEEQAGHVEDLAKRLGSARKRELEAAVCECRSRISLRRREWSTAFDRASQSVLLEPRSGAYCCLAWSHLARAVNNGHNLPEILEDARFAFLRARETDLRGRYQTEILQILHQMENLKAGPGRNGTPERGA